MTDRERYSAAALIRFASDLLQAAHMDSALANAVARNLVEGDLFGHDTHGLALLAPYIGSIEAGGMALSGTPEVLSDRGAALHRDGRRLPGP